MPRPGDDQAVACTGCSGRDDGVMATTARTQRRYDHRFRDLVRTTRDIDCALQRGVPRSTARSWLTEPTAAVAEVVTVDVLDMNAVRLQKEVLRLRARVQKLIALLRVVLVSSGCRATL